jgi:hypothetical protein
MVFMQPQRLVVPLFQRPYVWNEENQWEPLWNDVIRVGYSPSDWVYPMSLSRVVRLFFGCFVWLFLIVWWAAKPSAGER